MTKIVSSKSHSEKAKVANKLHRQFAQCSSEKLKKFLNSASPNEEELIRFKSNVLHIIDHAPSFSAATLVKSKKKEEIAKVIIKNWIISWIFRKILQSVKLYVFPFKKNLI